ncbi:MAG TPA: type II secretion system F family protein [Armatimonadota bacterium]|jgi:tight adherence protein C
MLIWLIAITSFVAVAFLASALTSGATVTPRARLHKLDSTPAFGTPPRTRATDTPFGERVVLPTLRRLALVAEKLGLAADAHVMQGKLEAAGHPTIFGISIGVREYMAVKLICYALAVVVLLALLRNPLLDGPLGIGVAGLITIVIGMLPTLVVDHLADARKQAVLKSMSDILDLLVVSAEAGLSLDASMGRVAQKKRGPLADEFEMALQEMRLGKSRADALRGIARRTTVLEVKMFTSAIIQAENLGVSIAQVLRTQAETHRERRSQHVREAAAKLPVKMMLPLVFFILPAIFVVLAAPGLMGILAAMPGR